MAWLSIVERFRWSARSRKRWCGGRVLRHFFQPIRNWLGILAWIFPWRKWLLEYTSWIIRDEMKWAPTYVNLYIRRSNYCIRSGDYCTSDRDQWIWKQEGCGMERLCINQDSAKQSDCTSRSFALREQFSKPLLIDDDRGWCHPMHWGLRDTPTSAIWYPYVCFCFQHIAWLLQAKVEEPRAADTEGPAMNPQDATDASRAVRSRAKRVALRG